MGKYVLNAALKAIRFWLSQAMICKLYGKAKATISEHIKHIFEEGELEEIQLFGFTEQLPVMEKIIRFNTLVCL